MARWPLELHEVALLEAACRELSAAHAAEAAVERDGQLVGGRFGPRLHPALALARASRQAFGRLLAQLDLAPPGPDPSAAPFPAGLLDELTTRRRPRPPA